MTDESTHPVADAIDWLIECQHRTMLNVERAQARQDVDDAIAKLVDARAEKALKEREGKT